MTAYRTPLKNVRGLGAAKGGTEHFIVQRVTAAANIILIAFLVYAALSLAGASRAEVKAFFSQPFAAIFGVLLGVSASVHMRIGMQVIVEDYVHGGWKVLLLLLNTFFSIFAGAAIVLAVIKLYLGV
ncbi:MAG: succinate dehydrogenase, hydrophobic membrane anchor protein [Rhodomicrobium sp.]